MSDDNNNEKISFLNNLLKICSILLILLCYSYQCPAFPVWPVSEPVSEDRIGNAGDGPIEFNYNLNQPVIEYHVGDDWIMFPYKLKNKAHDPHTVHIIFYTSTQVSPRNLVLGVDSDAPNQLMVVYFDDHHIGEEIIKIDPISEVVFWLGVIEKGPHRITITNGSTIDPNTDTPGYGIRFDFIQLISPDFKTINIPKDDCPTIKEGIQEAIPGDTIYVKKGIYRENNIVLKSGLTLLGEAPDETIIDGDGKTVIIGAYQSQVKGFTIKNAGFTNEEDQVGIKIFDDFMSLSNNIILSCKIGVSLTGKDFYLVNNTLVKNDCSLYVLRSDANAPLPTLKCKNNIFGDGNYALSVLSDTYSSLGIDPNEFDKVIEDFSFNNIFTRFQPNVDIMQFGKGNIQTNPYFEDTNVGNYHLEPYSQCIDTGDPNADFSKEPENNGQRINMGAFGNTEGATRTLDSDGDGVKDYIEGLEDRDLDGKQDWSDKQTGLFISVAGNKEIWVSMEGDANTPLAFKEIRAIEQTDPSISGFRPPLSHFLYGFWGFKIIGVEHGAKITVKIHFPQELFENQGYHAYDPNNGWLEMSIRQDASGRAISIDLFDGDTGDMDRIPNGSVSHIGGVSVASPLHDDLGSIDCFIRSVKAKKN